MQNADDVNAVSDWPVKNDAVADGQAAKFGSKLRSFPAHFRHRGQERAFDQSSLTSGLLRLDSVRQCEKHFNQVKMRLARAKDLWH